MDKYLIAIGGGEIRNKTTLKIDEYIAGLAKKHAGEKRATALFFGTASHDSMPYFNSFRKTYTSVFDIKAEVGLLVYGEMDIERIKNKIDAADCIYVGGGDTLFMMDLWRKKGVDKMLISAYEQGKIICGLSAGAICWFSDIYTDSEIMNGKTDEYKLEKGLGLIQGLITPHFNERENDFIPVFGESRFDSAYAIENDAAIVFKNGLPEKALSSGGKAYLLTKESGTVVRREINE